MPLFIVVAKHGPESCNIQAKVGAESQHTLHLVMDAQDSQKVDEFMTPFAQMGTVEVTPGIACEAIVARGRC